MSNYNKATNFAVKDTLTSGDPDKIVSGAEIDNEFNSIASSITSKVDKVAAATTNNLAALDANGNVKDSGVATEATVPSGGVIMWSGLISAIPTGWNLCDGSNGTPDLRNRFVVGAGGQYDRNDTGGANSVQLTENEMPSHDHTMDFAGNHLHSMSAAGDHSHSMNSAGGHSHIISIETTELTGELIAHPGNRSFVDGVGGVFSARNFSTRVAQGSAGTGPNDIDFDATHSHSASADTVSDHTHTINAVGGHIHFIDNAGSHLHNINNSGGNRSHENRPPYFALAFIMKL